VGGLDYVNADYCVVQVGCFMLWVIGMLFIQLRELSQAGKAQYQSHLFADISGQCWQCEEVQGGDWSWPGRGGWIWLHQKWVQTALL